MAWNGPWPYHAEAVPFINHALTHLFAVSVIAVRCAGLYCRTADRKSAAPCALVRRTFSTSRIADFTARASWRGVDRTRRACDARE